MEEKQITITEALRFARHEFMNQLQLIRMNLELGRIDDAKSVIDSYASRMLELAELNKLGLPKLYEWIQTAAWKFPGLNVVFSCRSRKVNGRFDDPSVQLMDKLFREMSRRLDPFEEMECQVEIKAVNGNLMMGITVLGELENLDCAMITDEQNILQTAIEQSSPKEWKITVTAR